MNESSNEIKKLQALIDIINYLAEHRFTYNEAEDFLLMLKNEISASRDCNEFKTADDWFCNRPCCDIANTIIVPNKVNVRDILCDSI